MRIKTLAPCASWLLCGALSAAAQYQVRFDQARYEITRGQMFEVQVLIDPVPAQGLSSFGVIVAFPGGNASVSGPLSISPASQLSNDGVRGPDAVKAVTPGFAAVKGTVDFSLSPAQPYEAAVLATVTIQDLGIGPYTINLSSFNTLGPTEEIFVDGAGAVLDPEITFGSATVQYRAPSPQLCAIFANEANQPPKTGVVSWKGQRNAVTGKIHSNSDVDVSGNNHVFRNGVVEYVTGINPVPDFNGKATLQSCVVTQSIVEPYPVNFTLADFAPGGAAAVTAQALGKFYYVKGDTHLDAFITNGVLKDGLYYVEGKIHLTGNSLSGTVTLVATDEIQVSSSSSTFQSFTRCLLAFSGKPTGRFDASAIKFSGSGIKWQGIIFAPGGGIDVTGSGNAVLLGSLIGRGVTVSGSDFQITGIDLNNCAPLVSPLAPVMVGRSLQLVVPTVSGLVYAIEYSDSLAHPDWKTWTVIQGDGTAKILQPPTDAPQRYFRLRLD